MQLDPVKVTIIPIEQFRIGTEGKERGKRLSNFASWKSSKEGEIKSGTVILCEDDGAASKALSILKNRAKIPHQELTVVLNRDRIDPNSFVSSITDELIHPEILRGVTD